MNREGMRLFRARRQGRLLVQALVERLSRPLDSGRKPLSGPAEIDVIVRRGTGEVGNFVPAYGLLDGQVIIQPDRPGEAAETVFIGIRRRRIRLLDSIYVRYAGIDVWLPLLARLRLRRVVRCVVAEETRQGLLPSPKATKDVAGRRSYDTEDTDDLGR